MNRTWAPAPLDGLTYGVLHDHCGINDGGPYAFGSTLPGLSPTAT